MEKSLPSMCGIYVFNKNSCFGYFYGPYSAIVPSALSVPINSSILTKSFDKKA